MASGVIEKRILIHAKPEAVYAALQHPNSVVGLQPLITHIEILKEGCNPDGQVYYDYLAEEHIRLFGIIPYVNQIQVTMRLIQAPYHLQQEALAPMGIRLMQNWHLQAHEAGCAVLNHLEYATSPLIAWYIAYEISRVHGQSMQRLKARVEGLTE